MLLSSLERTQQSVPVDEAEQAAYYAKRGAAFGRNIMACHIISSTSAVCILSLIVRKRCGMLQIAKLLAWHQPDLPIHASGNVIKCYPVIAVLIQDAKSR